MKPRQPIQNDFNRTQKINLNLPAMRCSESIRILSYYHRKWALVRNLNKISSTTDFKILSLQMWTIQKEIHASSINHEILFNSTKISVVVWTLSNCPGWPILIVTSYFDYFNLLFLALISASKWQYSDSSYFCP